MRRVKLVPNSLASPPALYQLAHLVARVTKFEWPRVVVRYQSPRFHGQIAFCTLYLHNMPFHDVAAIVNSAAVGDRVLFVVTYEMHVFHTGKYTCTLHNTCESQGKRGKARQDGRVVRLASSHLSMGPTRSPHASPVDWLTSPRTLHVRQKFASLATRRAR